MSEKPAFFEDKKDFLKKIFWIVIFGLFVNVLIALFSDFNSTIGIIKKVDKIIIFKSSAIFFIIYFIDTLRLKLVLGIFNYKISFRTAFYNSLSGYFIANLTPMASGGQPYQIYHLVKNNIDSKTATNAIASRFIEFLLFSSFFVLIFIRKILKLLSNQFIGKKILIFGLAVSLVITVFMFVIFINPNIIVSFIKFLGKKTKKEKIINRIKRISEWTDELRESIIFLWTEKFYILIMDFILGIAETFVQAYAFFIILKYFSIMNLNFFDIFIIYILLNFVIYFVPTPGSSGGVEGIYNTVLIGLIGNKNYVIAAIFIWRLSTYYFQIIVQFFLMLLLRGEKNENSRINSNI